MTDANAKNTHRHFAQAALATFGAGYIARPVGAIVFGHIGDKFGRKTALSLTLLLMGMSSTLIGVLPTYESAGVLAPALLVLLRLLQGLGSGAEFAGSFVMVAEFAPAKRRGYWASLPGTGVYGGIILATIVGLTVFQLPDEQLYSWGWRLPFLVSFVLIIIGLVLRLRLSESPVFKELAKRKESHSLPFVAIFRKSPKRLFLAILLTAPIAFNAHVSSTYALTFGVAQGVSRTGVLLGSLLGAIAAFILVPVAGRLSDRYGRRPIYMIMTGLGAIGTFPYFMLVLVGTDTAFWAAHVLVMAPFTQALTGAQAAFLTELFPSRHRYTGVALSRELSTALLASIAPITALGLVTAAGGQPWLLAGFMSLLSLAALAGAYFLPETRGMDMLKDDIDESDAEESTDVPSTQRVGWQA